MTAAGILLRQQMGRLHAATLHLSIGFPLTARSEHLGAQGGSQLARQHYHSVFATFGVPHDDDVPVEINNPDALCRRGVHRGR